MKALVPSITHWPSSRRARVRSAAASEPPPGSVSPNEPSPCPDRHGAEADRGLQGDRHRGVDPGQLLDRQTEGEVVRVHAAVAFRERQAEQAHAGHLVEHGVVEPLGAVHRLGSGRDHLLGEGPDDLAELLLLGGERELHGRAPSWGCKGWR
jgi:hypothetical protein